uniref:Anaphase-promoting complex subunit 4-like WD40 domain-containing protein n=1 Tax=Kwoniella pini CBS 10737 TaxID=1296096 RepID=A0A1B9HVW9_9TREE|nr:uncharacterized protein I206_06308 [Kwoniella pini CBS 10737]OCF47409.1 hypothetical protein I206_06308 [Kwoniella pini CBS 10737]
MVNEGGQPYRPDFFPIAQPAARDLLRPAFGRSQDIRGGNVKHVRSVAWSCDGRRVATGGEFKEILVWDTKLNARGSTPLPSSSKTNVHNGHVGSIAWSPVDPHILVSGDKGASAGGVIAVWDVTSNSSPIASFKIPGDVLHISFHPSGRHFAVVCPQRNKDEVFFYWRHPIDGVEKWERRDDVALGGALMDFGAEEINSLRFDNSGKLVCAVSNDGSINAWIYPTQLQAQQEQMDDTLEPRVIKSGPSTTPSTPKLPVEVENAEILKSREGSREGSPENTREGKETAEEDTEINEEEQGKVNQEGEEVKQTIVAEGDEYKQTEIEGSEDVEMKEPAQEMEALPTTSAAPSRQPTPPLPPNQTLIKPAEKKKAGQLQRFRHAVCHSASLLSLAFDPQGKYLAVGGQDALLSMFDTRNWICERTFDVCTSAIRHIAFSHDGEFIALGGDDSYIAIVSVYSGALVAKLPVYGMVSSIAWHPKTNWLAYSYSGKVASPIWHIVHQET